MSTATETAPEGVHDDHGEHDDHEHGLSDFGYIKVALLLAVLTAAEVMTYFVDFGPVEVPGLLILMVAKFWIVVAYFMHLRFDNKLFTWLFVGGLVLAVAVYAAFATSMVFWTDPAGCDLSPNATC
ncbi:cytochrome C oxidase subunit IV family protein [Candidatus Poriferisodalis sp.]|uniref:cytochrome C oxidase subunit IV family protein n=1 Tax=Candidatus Poriferisodalis sp. TaxID=3101277 RepID=UPI003AF6E813